MTIAKTTSRVAYAGNDSTTAFAYGYRFFADGDLQVYVKVDSTGVETLKTLTTNYTVANNGDETGGTVTMLSAPATGETLTILRSVPLTQSTDYASNDAFPAESHEEALDRLTLQGQEVSERMSRGLINQPSDGDMAAIPSAADRASSYFGWDSSGDPVVLAAPTDTAITTAWSESLLDDANAAAGRDTLEIDNRLITGGIIDLGTLNTETSALLRYVLTAQGTGAGNVMQGFCTDPYLGELYTSHVTGSGPETHVLNKYNAHGIRTQTSVRWNSAPVTTIGHQALAISWDKDGGRWFWTSRNDGDTDYQQYVTRFQVADGAGTELTISGSEHFRLFTSGTGHVTPCVSLDGRYLIAENSSQTVETVIKVFDLQALMDGGAGDYSSSEILEFATKDVNSTTLPLQSIMCDGNYIYLFSGDGPTTTPNTVLIYDMHGTLVQEIDDFTVGETDALGDDTGTDHYEPEGAGWVWNNGKPYLGISIASGDSGSRVNRIWALGANLPSVSYGNGNRPAFIASGTNDFGIPTGQVIRTGHYAEDTDTFTERMAIATDGATSFGANNTGTWTGTIEDNATRGSGNASATTATGTFERIGGVMHLEISFSNISIVGMTGGNNAFIHGVALSPSPSNFTMTPDSNSPLSIYMSDLDVGATTYQVTPVIDTSGYIVLREMIDAAVSVITNVSQIDGADLHINGVFKV